MILSEKLKAWESQRTYVTILHVCLVFSCPLGDVSDPSSLTGPITIRNHYTQAEDLRPWPIPREVPSAQSWCSCLPGS